MGKQGQHITEEAEAKMLACFEAGHGPNVTSARVPEVHRTTVYLRYRKWKGVPAKPRPPKPPKQKRAYTQRVRGNPPRYTGPTWIGKAITK